jgi:hypothetical protein
MHMDDGGIDAKSERRSIWGSDLSCCVPFVGVVDLPVALTVLVAVLCGCTTLDGTSPAPGVPERSGWSRPKVPFSLEQAADARVLARSADSRSGATGACAEWFEARCSRGISDAPGSSARSGSLGDAPSDGSDPGSPHPRGGQVLLDESRSISGIGLSDPEGGGATGAQGLVLPVNGWSVYREYTFVRDGNAIGHADRHKAREIADLLNQHPSYRIGIDGARQERVNNVRRALIDAGVAADVIEMGEFGDPQLRRDRWVAVLIRI